MTNPYVSRGKCSQICAENLTNRRICFIQSGSHQSSQFVLTFRRKCCFLVFWFLWILSHPAVFQRPLLHSQERSPSFVVDATAACWESSKVSCLPLFLVKSKEKVMTDKMKSVVLSFLRLSFLSAQASPSVFWKKWAT